MKPAVASSQKHVNSKAIPDILELLQTEISGTHAAELPSFLAVISGHGVLTAE